MFVTFFQTLNTERIWLKLDEISVIKTEKERDMKGNTSRC